MKLKTRDVIAFARLIMNIGIKDELQKVLVGTEGQNAEQIGYSVIWSILEKSVQENAEDEIYRFLSRYFEMSPEEVGDLSPMELLEKIKEVADFGEWKNFFISVLSLSRKK